MLDIVAYISPSSSMQCLSTYSYSFFQYEKILKQYHLLKSVTYKEINNYAFGSTVNIYNIHSIECRWSTLKLGQSLA